MLEHIYATYSLVNGWFNEESLQNQHRDSHSWLRMKELNDYAYFVLLFAQLEDDVNYQFQRKKDQDFEIERRYPGKIDFMEKLDVVFNGKRTIHNLVDRYYEVRNAIAHGRDMEEGLFLRYITESSLPITIDTLHNDIRDLLQQHSS